MIFIKRVFGIFIEEMQLYRKQFSFVHIDQQRNIGVLLGGKE